MNKDSEMTYLENTGVKLSGIFWMFLLPFFLYVNNLIQPTRI